MFYCKRCDREFRTRSDKESHLINSSSHNICRICNNIDYPTFEEIQNHWIDSPAHNYCPGCNFHYDTEIELSKHFEAEHEDMWCAVCKMHFFEEEDIQEHRMKLHENLYCDECGWVFETEIELKGHLNSSYHHKEEIFCTRRGCNAKFTDESDLALHLKSRSCRGYNPNRNRGNQPVSANNTDKKLSDPQVKEVKQTLIATVGITSFNGVGYECYLCHRVFEKLNALNQHLQSPIHRAKIYRCPDINCQTEFTDLSALFTHIESGSCGIIRFIGNGPSTKNLQGSGSATAIEDLSNGMKRLGVRKTRGRGRGGYNVTNGAK